MKINALERAMILITAVALAFFAGYYVRGTVVRDTIQIETQKAPSVTILQGDRQSLPEDTHVPDSDSDLVLTLEEETQPAPEMSRTIASEQISDGRIDLNTADAAALETLPGIGPVLAERIIEYRETYGRFYSVEEVMNVSGIGEKTYAGIADLIKVEVEK